MSITLMAYPTAFLISPSKAKGERLSKLLKNYDVFFNQMNRLTEVCVCTNLSFAHVHYLMPHIEGCYRLGEDLYEYKNDLKIRWQIIGNKYYAILSGDSESITKYGEEFFAKLDDISEKNVRDIDNSEYFYYRYRTEYTNISELKKELQKNGISGIEQISDNELCANADDKKIRFYKKGSDETFTLEVEQKISLVNIGLANSLTEIEIQTNIKQDELENFILSTMYKLDRKNLTIKLNYLNTPVQFVLKDGFYSLKFSSCHIAPVRDEIEELFKSMNKKAGRDLRIIEDNSCVNYVYKTNYTDKGVLINTLLEHGAQNLFEEDGNVYCDLYGMQMNYKRENETESYILEICQVNNKSKCESLIDDINDEYGLNIQELTYRKILERLQKENMRLESEEVTDDNSIILTIDVG